MFFNFLFSNTPLFYLVQSFWRDEAFSVIFARQSLITIVTKSTIEPPLYYFLLHFWMQVFGTSEVAVRSLSLVGFALATIVVIEWSEKLFSGHWLTKFTPLFFFLNPMFLYYACEARAYGWYIFFAILSMFAFDQKKWGLYIVGVTLGLYTHFYLGIIPLVHLLYYAYQNRIWHQIKHPKKLFTYPLIRSLLIIGILFLPWIIHVLSTLTTLKQTWYFPITVNLIFSVLGSMFLGYEGTPWHIGGWITLISFILFLLFSKALVLKKTRAHTILLFLQIFLPLVGIIGISYIKPMFTIRYLIPVTIAEVLLLSFTIRAISNTVIQKICAGILLGGIVLFNCWYPTKHAKLDIRKAVQEVNAIKTPKDFIVASDVIIFMETLFYAKDIQSVRLYNPYNNPFPWYIGDTVYSPKYNMVSLPHYPNRAFFIEKDGTYTIRYKISHTN